MDNPDQRIGEDISTFTTNCIAVLVVFVGAVLKVGSFVGVLLSISPRLTVFVLVYSIVGTLSTTAMFGARLKHLIFEGAKREANFRCDVHRRTSCPMGEMGGGFRFSLRGVVNACLVRDLLRRAEMCLVEALKDAAL